ncbi:MAG TPA: hypothetical protein EYG68_04195 [Leucothrix mucor]|nr:hypothetical protein [Leucothrix mucor]
MGEAMYADQYLLQNILNNEFMRLYLSISNTYRKHGHSSKCTRVLKQFAEYFYRQAIQKKQYQVLRSQMINNTLSSGTPQRCEIFSNEKISGCLYALPSNQSISAKLLKGNINILTVNHGAMQIENKASKKFTMPSQCLTLGQSVTAMKTKDINTHFRAKTSVTVFLCVSCSEIT